MDRGEARESALSILRSRMEHGWQRQSIEAITHEGSCGPSSPGYFIAGGRITVPHAFRHDQPDAHTFRLAELFDELESPQGGLFG